MSMKFKTFSYENLVKIPDIFGDAELGGSADIVSPCNAA